MKSYLILLPIFFISLLQGTFLSLNLALLAVLILAAIKSRRQSLIISFLTGFFLDLAKGTPLGLSSFVFLIISYLMILYRRKFDPFHPVFLTIFVFLSSGFYSQLVFHFFNWREGLVLAGLALLIRPLVAYFFGSFDHQEIKLKV
jgi:rod shape-determining protein MreD